MYAFLKVSKGVGGGGELIMETHCRSMASTISGLQTNSGKMVLDNQNEPPACKRYSKKVYRADHIVLGFLGLANSSVVYFDVRNSLKFTRKLEETKPCETERNKLLWNFEINKDHHIFL